MHIPDGFLSTPVWAAFDVVTPPAVVWLSRAAQRASDESRVPLLGVMGAFVFAAQMFNFPVAAGTSGHLVGSALLTYTLGPATAAVVLTAVLVLQALVFQDGGLLALGANVFNMAIAGVAFAYLPYRLAGGGRWRRPAIFAGGFVSVFGAAMLALAQLLVSGVRMPEVAVWLAFGLFGATALLEGAVTLAILEAMGRLNRAWVRSPGTAGGNVLLVLGAAALLLVCVGVFYASASPDGLETVAEHLGIAGQARNLIEGPFADYEARFLADGPLRQILPGLAGLLMIAGLSLLLARAWRRRRG